MVPASNIYAPKAAPPVLVEFFYYLKANHPTVNLTHIHLELVPRQRVKKLNATTAATGTANKFDGMLFSYLKVAIGTARDPRPLELVLHTLPHEYRHAVQHDQGRESDCGDCNSWAAYVVPHFLRDLERAR